MSSLSVFALCVTFLIQVNYSVARRSYTVISSPAVYASNLLYVPTIADQSCVYGSSYGLPVSYDSYSLADYSTIYPTSVSCIPTSVPSYISPPILNTPSVSVGAPFCRPTSVPSNNSPPSLNPSINVPLTDSYGGEGTGIVGVDGTVDARGSTRVSGSVPVQGAAGFRGSTPAYGSVSIRGQCECEF
ncbi:uncharacterized protein LOC125238554 [Leguminivora glycinivorella]|uniref:uncharacterized protein LOC125238554 n=1 Tax=Leguminivora glycinivorella TaxID=1035111 RepID=UPI00200E5227|nr:uncharacterized protein LOC125238554 [Leguminivora glycinivorella]